LQKLFATRTRDEWVSDLAEIDIPFSPVNGLAEAFNDPQLRYREMLISVDHPIEGRIPQLGFPIKFSDTVCSIRTPPPRLGEHTDAVLRNLGYADSDIERLRQSGAV
jgi:crotonobetainyl-CoA:carnitine CoA-transferase CaiB-like acyl-CoA transferase